MGRSRGKKKGSEEFEPREVDDFDGGKAGRKKRRRSEFVDDVAEEEEEREYRAGKRRRSKRKSGLQYLDWEAVVDDDEEEDQEDEEGFDDDFIENGSADILDKDDAIQTHRSFLVDSEDDEEEDIEALEKRVQERYGKRDLELDEEPTEVEQQALLPTIRDPKLWRVTCVNGHEREVAFCLMQKSIDEGSQLQIRSAVALDHIKNYIYVEADKEAHVKEACKGLCKINSKQIMLVPLKEMTDVLSVKTKAVHLSRGAWVRMRNGMYKGELAKVVDIDNVRQKVTVKLFPSNNLRALDYLVMSPKELCKYFEPGNHVKIICGAAEGTTGFVVSVEGHLVNIISDTTKELLQVFADHVMEISEAASGVDQIEDFELHNLVQLDDSSFGVIIHIENESFQVLKGIPGKAVVEIVKLGNIRCKLDGIKYQTKDQLNHQLSVNDLVKVVEGVWRGRTGKILHIYKGNLFIYDHHHLENAGFMCAKSQSCILLAGGSRATNNWNGENTSSCSRVHLSQQRSSRGCSSMNARGRYGFQQERDALIGAFIKIREGVYKGHKGRVKNIKGKNVQVELEAQMRVVLVGLDQITDTVNISMPSRQASRSGFESGAPDHSSQTPLPPCMTPMRDHEVHDGGWTPVHDRAWNSNPTVGVTAGLSGNWV
ncbi:putative transcription elongation factor SPT5 homolog 1 isoform X2 [Coffea arabica]|uniref:Transcription elongation factor SPT5 homolog 1 isoform X2 n=1 Tax=Coffea arabica TaxID=13443 RepID=A0ABM4VN65_COFAR